MFKKNCVFFQEFSLFCHLSLAKNWAGISCTKIGVTVHGVDDSFENLLQRYVGEGRVAVNDEKNTIFPEHPVFMK